MGQAQKPSFKMFIIIKASGISSHTDRDDLGKTGEDQDTRQGEKGFREGDRDSSSSSLFPYC